METYNFDEIIDRSGTYCTQWDYVQDRFGKAGVIPFTISDSDFKVMPEINEALMQRVEHGIYGYTRWNHADFKGAISYWFKTMHNTTIKEADIVYGPSVMYMIKSVLEKVSKEAEGVISFHPMYDGFIKLIRGLKRSIVPINIASEVFEIDWVAFEAACAEKQNTVLLLCNPLNPIGKCFSKAELLKIVQICQKNSVFIISDDIHMDYVYKGNSYIPIIKIAELVDYEKKVVLISSSTKTFNTAGLMGAYMIMPAETMQADYLYKLREIDCLSSAPIMGIVATIIAYTKGEHWVKELRNYLQDTFKYIEAFIEENNLPITFKQPDATYFAWFDMKNLGLTEEILQEKLLEKNVAIMSGSYYMLESGNYLRLNIAAPRSKIVIAMEAIRDVYQESLMK